eukprot:Gregarina_sp_Poly_1__4946@NODE_261_length_10458_cov_187_060244_g228_i0_p15_GENE_NODE_261_length_10458_cov_187_060244_g228_i0NODE_261_length_10458_cov_187_060244_g228_i0_p15_ORF_typecomplete_len100_score8_47_NODE_261_length_10458_cov_187_060244_g228_i033953694
MMWCVSPYHAPEQRDGVPWQHLTLWELVSRFMYIPRLQRSERKKEWAYQEQAQISQMLRLTSEEHLLTKFQNTLDRGLIHSGSPATLHKLNKIWQQKNS